MRLLLRSMVVAGFALALAPAIDASALRQTQAGPPSPTPAELAARQTIAGTWDYNSVDSVNAATGRPEQNPRGGARTATPAPSSGAATSGRGVGPTRMGGVGAGSVETADPGRSRPTDSAAARVGRARLVETRALTRDLLEIPEGLTIDLLPDAVRVVDDLQREWVFPTDDHREKYQFGGSFVGVRTRWEGANLVQEFEGTAGFKVTQTYLPSSDGQRLFVIIRVGEQKKDAPVVGFNRVYDRVER